MIDSLHDKSIRIDTSQIGQYGIRAVMRFLGVIKKNVTTWSKIDGVDLQYSLHIQVQAHFGY